MRTKRILALTAAILSLVTLWPRAGFGAYPAPHIQTMSVPVKGSIQILFHCQNTGPFRVQMRTIVTDPWADVAAAVITEWNTGVYVALLPSGINDMAFFRIVSENETIVELKGWTIRLEVSAPSNSLYFVVGESPVVTVRILDNFAQGITKDDFSSLNLYLYGPQDPQKTVTAVKLLNASTNRAARPHHYIDLKTNPDAQVANNVITYPLKPVTDEAPGTYRLAVWAVLGSDAIQQVMKFAELQIRTASVETPVTSKAKCASCHEGTISKKVYLHHIDPGYSPVGLWSIDYEPQISCQVCHNHDGYAGIRDVYGNYMSDSTVRRIHGVHMGEGLDWNFNTNEVNGDFRHYTHVRFPADVKNCTACHVDDRWKTRPSRTACGSCHDNRWFGALDDMPAGMTGHTGGPRFTDAGCWVCHPEEGIGEFDYGIVDAHRVFIPTYRSDVSLAMSPPANGSYYVNGEAPQVTIRVTNKLTGLVVNPSNIVEALVRTNPQPNEWTRGNLFVSGPRAWTEPVLTTAALLRSTNGYYAANDFRVRVNPANEDPRVTRTADAIVYQLAAVSNLAPGTYTAYAEVAPNVAPGGFAYLNFQIGTVTNEPMVATSCIDCHGDTRMHHTSLAVPFNADICKSCHDNLRQTPGKIGWTNSNFGFGAAPLSRRIHGVHFGKYLEKPNEIHPAYDYSEVIFPQDVRNCTKCHSQKNTWTTEPSRVACLSCHDNTIATAHGTLMTLDYTPQDPFSGDEIETCTICHGERSTFTPSAVHSIANPYVPPYPR